MHCRICNVKLSADYVFREMMFGMRDQFKYSECPACGCIQILEIPADMERSIHPITWRSIKKFLS